MTLTGPAETFHPVAFRFPVTIRGLAQGIPSLVAPDPAYDRTYRQPLLMAFGQFARRFSDLTAICPQLFPDARLIPQFHLPRTFDGTDIAFLALWGASADKASDKYGLVGYMHQPFPGQIVCARVAHTTVNQQLKTYGDFMGLTAASEGGGFLASVALGHIMVHPNDKLSFRGHAQHKFFGRPNRRDTILPPAASLRILDQLRTAL
jgi:hypothetical protein